MRRPLTARASLVRRLIITRSSYCHNAVKLFSPALLRCHIGLAVCYVVIAIRVALCYIYSVYKIAFTKAAAKALRKMPRNWSLLIRKKLSQLAEDPYAPQNNVVKLQNRPGYRLRVGDWRIIYDIENERLVILILVIKPRGEVYK